MTGGLISCERWFIYRNLRQSPIEKGFHMFVCAHANR